MQGQKLRVAFVVGGFYTEASGIARAIASLAENLWVLGHEVGLFVPEYAGRPVASHLLAPGVKLYCGRGYWLFRLGWSPQLKRIMSTHLPSYDVVHTHSLWMLPTHYATGIAISKGIPVVASVQGFLDPWALRHHRLRKWVISSIFQREDLRRAAVVHALTEQEIEYIRAYCQARTVAVIPNGVPDRLREETGIPDRFFKAHPDLSQYRLMLFLSRLHYKKGLDILVDAWRNVCHTASRWKLVIAGPDDGYEQELRRRVRASGCEDSVVFLPAHHGQAKYDLIAASDCFVLPSRSEGLPMALLEAMALGKPVVYTTGCYFPEAARHHAGLEVECSVPALTQALKQIAETEPHSLREMGQRGRNLILANYLWSTIARKFSAVYEWLVNGRMDPAPETIRNFS